MDFESLSRVALSAYFETHGVVRHQLESFDHFADVMLPQIITENSDIVVTVGERTHTLKFSRVCVPPPTIRESDGFVRAVEGPAEAMARNLSYASAVLVDVLHTVDTVDGERIKSDMYREVVLCKIPIMVRSRYCYLSSRVGDLSSCVYDSGGYFVINGLEKTLIAQQKLRTNCAFVWPATAQSRATLCCEVRSCHEQKLRSTSTLVLHLMPGNADHPPHITVSLPFLETTVSLTALFKLLGCGTLEAMVEACGAHSGAHGAIVTSTVRDILIEGMEPETAEEIFIQVGDRGTTETTRQRRDRYMTHILNNEVLPHMGLGDAPQIHAAKTLYLGHMVHRLMLVHLGLRPVDDRDHFKLKRVDAPGHLCSLLFRQLFRAFLKSLNSQLVRTLSSPHRQLSIPKLVMARKITSGFKYAFATGNWGVQARSNTAQCGVAQVLNRNSIFASVSDKRRLSCPANRDSKNSAIRQQHPSAYGVVCPAETPEGQSCGLIVNLAVLAHVRINSCTQLSMLSVMKALPSRLGFVAAETAAAGGVDGYVRVFHNGVVQGFVHRTMLRDTVEQLRQLRADASLPSDCSVAYDPDAGEIHVGTDAGCLCRPVFVVARLGDLRSKVDECRAHRAPLWPTLVASGIVMYIDKEEEQSLVVAHSHHQLADAPGRFTHMEIHPSAILGMSASMIPFPHHNQAPRNTYQCAMGKQSIGVYASNAHMRFDTVGFGLWYPQRPLVGTWVDDVLGTKTIPAGTNAIVAIMTYGGFNQEDSLIFNKAALDRGMMRCCVARTVRDEAGSEGYTFCRPPSDCSQRRAGCYDKLRPCGTVPVGTVVSQGDVVIGKVRDADTKNGEVISQDHSTVAKCANEGVVTRVMYATNRDGLDIRKVRIEETRTPQTGDKFTSRHGQKGVIGAIYRSEDMPFLEDGRQPDIIMNPHALPSRMTIGQLVEMLLATLGCSEGKIGDGTAFGGHTVDSIAERLEAAGLDPHGNHDMYNGGTGNKMEARIFMGPVCMQSLKHMVDDKCHARARGPVDAKTRQPTEGRRQDGGLRFGEMERDCLIGHGAAAMLQERLFTQSDPYECTVCTQCGLLAEPACRGTCIGERGAFCRLCNSSEHVVDLPMPYATKLLLQEVMGTNIAPRIEVDAQR